MGSFTTSYPGSIVCIPQSEGFLRSDSPTDMSVARGEPEPNAGIILGVHDSDEGGDDDERAPR